MQLVSDSSGIPDRQAVIADLASSCAHVWCFWIEPRTDRPALLISSEWNLSGFLLLGLASSVEWWDTDCERAALLARVASDLGLGLCVRHCAAESLVMKVSHLKEPLGLAALQGPFGAPSLGGSGRRGGLLDRLRTLTAGHGQCCVITPNRFALRTRRQRDFATPTEGSLLTPAQARRRLAPSQTESVSTNFFHPDHVHPTEILTPPDLLPAARRNHFWARLLQRLGIVDKIIGSFSCVVPFRQEVALLQEMLRELPRGPALPDQVTWGDCVVREGSMLFLEAGVERANEVLLRVPLSQDAADALHRADRVYTEMLETLPWLRRLIPEASPMRDVRGWPARVEQRCHGITARTLVRDPSQRGVLRRRVEEFVSTLCGSTTRTVTVGDTFIEKHITSKFASIRAAAPALSSQLSIVEASLVDMTRGRAVPTVRIHGDVNMGNLFFDPDTLRLTGVIDWEASVPDSLPFDLLHYLLSEQQELQKRTWGDLLAGEFSARTFDDDARGLLASHLADVGLAEDLVPTLRVAYWIRGVAVRIERSGGRLAANWQRQNLAEPLVAIVSALART